MKVLNPLGSPPSVPLTPIAARPAGLAGKTVFLVDVRFMNGDVLLEELQQALRETRPEIRTELRRKKGGYAEDDPELWAEIRQKGGAMVMAVGH